MREGVWDIPLPITAKYDDILSEHNLVEKGLLSLPWIQRMGTERGGGFRH
jgi:hypothetical protein